MGCSNGPPDFLDAKHADGHRTYHEEGVGSIGKRNKPFAFHAVTQVLPPQLGRNLSPDGIPRCQAHRNSEGSYSRYSKQRAHEGLQEYANEVDYPKAHKNF